MLPETARRLALIRDGAAKGLSRREIAERHGLTYQQVAELAYRYAIEIPSKPRVYTDLETYVAVKCGLGWPAEKTAELYGVTVEYVMDVAKSRGYERRVTGGA